MDIDLKDKYFLHGLKKIRKANNLSQRELAERAVRSPDGVESLRVAISNIERGARPPSKEAQWLLAEAFNLTPEQVMECGRQVLEGKPEAKLRTEHTMNVIVSRQQDKEILDKTTHDYRAIPLYESGRLAAGVNGLYFNEYEIPESEVIVYRPELNHRVRHNLCAVRVGGDSMEPMIPEGSIVVIDLDDKEFFDRKVFCVKKPDDADWMAAVKRVRKWERGFVLVSENPEYLPEPVEVEWRDLCVGRVIWMWRSIEEV